MYYIIGGSDAYWTQTNAKTLLGAKRCATNLYQVSVGGKIKVGQLFGDKADHTDRIETVAVKHGYDKWQSAY